MTTARVRGLRGATTVDADTPDDIEQRTLEMLGEIMRANHLSIDDLISILFTATADVVSAFPATAARQAGFGSIPLICAQEIPVPGSMPRCIRVLLHVTTSTPADELHHIYLHGAKGLRDDLPG
jgi:chorismate mutase